MAGNEYAEKNRQRKAVDLVAAANHFVDEVGGQNPDDRIVVLSALIGSLNGDFGPERQANDWQALTDVAGCRPPQTSKPLVLKMLDHQLHMEQLASSPYRSDPFAGLTLVQS